MTQTGDYRAKFWWLGTALRNPPARVWQPPALMAFRQARSVGKLMELRPIRPRRVFRDCLLISRAPGCVSFVRPTPRSITQLQLVHDATTFKTGL